MRFTRISQRGKSTDILPLESGTVDGRNPASQLRLVVYLITYRVLHIPGGARFLPSTGGGGKRHTKSRKDANIGIYPSLSNSDLKTK